MNKRNRSWKRILVFLLMVSMLLPMFAPVSAEAASYQKGSRGTEEIKRLQRNLTFLGYSTGGIDGSYGGKTEKAVMKLQADLHLEENGRVDPQLYTLITEVVMEIQTYLKQKKYYTGTIDGITGSGTEKALKKYQRSKGYSQTGVMSEWEFASMAFDLGVAGQIGALFEWCARREGTYVEPAYTEEELETLFYEHPEYLFNELTEKVITTFCGEAYLAVQENDKAKVFGAILTALSEGRDIIINELFSRDGSTMSYQEQMRYNAISCLMKDVCQNGNVVTAVAEEVGKNFETLNAGYTMVSEISKVKLLTDLSKISGTLSYGELEEIFNMATESEALGYFEGTVSAVEYFVALVQLYQIDVEIVERLMTMVNPSSDMYQDLEILLRERTEDPVEQALIYAESEYVKETLSKGLIDAALPFPGNVILTMTEASVGLFANHIYAGALSEEYIQALLLQSYVNTLRIALLDMRSELMNMAVAKEQSFDSTIMEDYEFLYTAYLSAVRNYLESAKNIAQKEYVGILDNNIRLFDGTVNYDAYIKACINSMREGLDKARPTVQEKLDLLLEKLGANSGKTSYFVVDKNKPCREEWEGKHSCTNCNVGEIVKTTWFTDLFGIVNVENFPEHDYKMTIRDRDNAGQSCFGFACFAQWYLYADSSTEELMGVREKEIRFNKEEIMKWVQPGDVIRVNGHSILVYEVGENGLTIVDCNWDMGGQLNCAVQKHTIRYNDWAKNELAYVNRVTKTKDIGAGKAGWFDVTIGDITKEEPEVPEVSEPVYQKGSRGTEVERLQKNLTFLGFSTGGADGAFGGKTETAVKQLQKKLGVEVTGKVDSELNQQIQKMVKEVQTYLSKKGYYSSTIDGITGSGTEKGLKKLQKEMGVSQTGTINSDVIEYMLGDGKVSVKFDAIIQLAEPTITPSVTLPITPSITPSVTPEITPTITETPEPPKEEKKMYTVTFNSNGGSVVTSKTVEEGTILSGFTTPSKEEHTFDGWMYGGKVVTNVTVTKDMTLTASWTPYKTMYVYYHYTTDAEVKGSDGKTMNPYTVCAYWGGTNWIDKSTNKYVSASKIYREELWLDEPLTASGTGFYHTKSSSCASYGCEEESFKNANAYRDRNYATNGMVWYNQKTISVPASTEEGVRK